MTDSKTIAGHWGRGDIYDRIVSALMDKAEVSQGKPAPDIFLLALERLGMSPSECVVLEDSPHGVKGALAAGIPALGFVGGSHLEGKRESHAKTLRDAGAAHVFHRLDDVARHILARTERSTG